MPVSPAATMVPEAVSEGLAQQHLLVLLPCRPNRLSHSVRRLLLLFLHRRPHQPRLASLSTRNRVLQCQRLHNSPSNGSLLSPLVSRTPVITTVLVRQAHRLVSRARFPLALPLRSLDRPTRSAVTTAAVKVLLHRSHLEHHRTPQLLRSQARLASDSRQALAAAPLRRTSRLAHNLNSRRLHPQHRLARQACPFPFLCRWQALRLRQHSAQLPCKVVAPAPAQARHRRSSLGRLAEALRQTVHRFRARFHSVPLVLEVPPRHSRSKAVRRKGIRSSTLVDLRAVRRAIGRCAECRLVARRRERLS